MPDWQFILWNESNIDFKVPAIAELYKAKKYNKVSDVIRHKAVLEMGGIYLDTDFEVFRPFDRLLIHPCFYGFQHEFHETDWIAPGAFGAQPGHWFVKKVLDRMLKARNSVLGVDIPTAIGPKLITTMLRDEGLKHYSDNGTYVKDIFLTPVHWFYPFPMGAEFTPDCVRDDTLAAHMWEKSWERYTSRTTKVLRGIRQMARRVGVK
jgi:mannosyltransferase OCH1-like enzyme